MTSAVSPRLRSRQGLRVPDCEGTGTAWRSYPTTEVRGGNERSYPMFEISVGSREKLSHAPTPPCPRPGAVAGRTNPTSKEPWLHECRRA